jgi:soluble lytic murein transglycosylase-like protein
MADWPFMQLASGLSINQAVKTNPATLAQDVLEHLHAYAKRGLKDPALLASSQVMMIAARTMGLDRQGMERLGRTPWAAIQKANKNFSADSISMNYSNKAVRELFNFSTELSRVGKWLDTTLTTKLSKVSASLTPLIQALGTDANKLLNDALSPENLKAIKDGLNNFTRYLTSGKLEASIEGFGHSLTKLSAWAASVYAFACPTKGHKSAGWERDAQKKLEQADSAIGRGFGDFFQAKTFLGGPALKLWNKEMHSPRSLKTSVADMGKYSASVNAAANLYHLSPALLAGIGAVESHGDPNARSTYYTMVNGKKVAHHAYGLFQITPGTAKQFDIHHLTDPTSSSYGAAKILSAYRSIFRKKYPTLPRDAIRAMYVAAYNEGPGTVESQYSKYGDNWYAHAAGETKGYIPAVQRATNLAYERQIALLSQIARNTAKSAKPVHVTVHNRNGSDVASSANMARHS